MKDVFGRWFSRFEGVTFFQIFFEDIHSLEKTYCQSSVTRISLTLQSRKIINDYKYY